MRCAPAHVEKCNQTRRSEHASSVPEISRGSSEHRERTPPELRPTSHAPRQGRGKCTRALSRGDAVYHKTIDAQSVVPQHRERIFFVGFREWRLRFAENGRAMLRKKRQLRRRGIIGKLQRLSRIRAEVLGDAALW